MFYFGLFSFDFRHNHRNTFVSELPLIPLNPPYPLDMYVVPLSCIKHTGQTGLIWGSCLPLSSKFIQTTPSLRWGCQAEHQGTGLYLAGRVMVKDIPPWGAMATQFLRRRNRRLTKDWMRRGVSLLLSSSHSDQSVHFTVSSMESSLQDYQEPHTCSLMLWLCSFPSSFHSYVGMPRLAQKQNRNASGRRAACILIGICILHIS